MNEIMIPIICCCLMMLIWTVSSVINRSAVSPGALFSGFWFFASGIPLVSILILGGEMQNMDLSYGLVTILCLLAFIASDAFSLNFLPKKARSRRKINEKSMGQLKKYYWIFLMAGFIYPIVLYKISESYFLSENILELPGMISHAKYTESWMPPAFLNFFMMSIFISALIAGFLLGCKNILFRNTFNLYLWTVPVFWAAYLNAARSALAMPAAFWLASYICGRVFGGGEERMRVKKVFLSIFCMAMLAFVIVHIGYMVRSSIFDLKESKVFLAKSISTIAGHMSVMQEWISKGGLWNSDHKTIYTFAGTAQMLGIGRRISGLYDENVSVNYGGELSDSNIYTAFRPLIDDFGLGGAFGGIGILSFSASVSWFFLKAGSIWGFPLLFIYYSFVLWSPITCIYSYNISLGAAAIGSILIISTLNCRNLFLDKDNGEKT